MNVSEIRDRILEISHNEASPDTDLNTKSLRWLNSAYHELVDELLPFLNRYLQREETVSSNANGVANLSNDVYRVVRLADVRAERVLKEIDRQDAMDMDPASSQTGEAKYFWVDGNTVTLLPRAETTLNVLYMPTVVDLQEDGTEASILIPRQFHHALVWGSLVWSSVFERGFSSQSDLALFQRKWEDAKEKIKLSLASKPSNALRVEPFDAAS